MSIRLNAAMALFAGGLHDSPMRATVSVLTASNCENNVLDTSDSLWLTTIPAKLGRL